LPELVPHCFCPRPQSCLVPQSFHRHVPTVLKYGSLNLQETSGSVQAWNRIVYFYPHWRLICYIKAESGAFIVIVVNFKVRLKQFKAS
jgi:hypothetical protein